MLESNTLLIFETVQHWCLFLGCLIVPLLLWIIQTLENESIVSFGLNLSHSFVHLCNLCYDYICDLTAGTGFRFPSLVMTALTTESFIWWYVFALGIANIYTAPLMTCHLEILCLGLCRVHFDNNVSDDDLLHQFCTSLCNPVPSVVFWKWPKVNFLVLQCCFTLVMQKQICVKVWSTVP